MPKEPIPYWKKLKDPRWQKRRLQILERDKWKCVECEDAESELQVHHKYYVKDQEPWTYPDNALVTLCDSCHEEARDYNKLFDATVKGFFTPGELFDLAAAFCVHFRHIPSVVVCAAIEELAIDESMLRLLLRTKLRRYDSENLGKTLTAVKVFLETEVAK